LNGAVDAINGDIDVCDCCWEACTGESKRLSSLNSTESWSDSGKIRSERRRVSHTVGRNSFGSVDIHFWEALMSFGRTVDGLYTEELNLIQSDCIFSCSFESIFVELWLSSSVGEINIVPTCSYGILNCIDNSLGFESIV
jgi:hypothetical protein